MPILFSNSRIRLSQGKIFWREIGRGTTLVFLHGSGRDSSQWVPLLEHLGQEYHCLALDLLGFGDSEHPNVHHSIQLQVECLASYLDALRLGQVCLIAHSLGGWVAASYGLQYPERVRGLVLFSPLGVEGPGDEENGRLERWLVSPFPIGVWALRSLRPLAKFLGWKEKIDKLLAYRHELLKSPTTCDLFFRRRPAEIQAERLDSRLELLKIPTVILQGKQDKPANLSRAQTYATSIPGAKLRLITEGDRDLPETSVDVAIAEIRQFLDAIEVN